MPRRAAGEKHLHVRVGPLTARLGQSWWWVTTKLASDPRSRWMTAAGPLVVILTVAVWLLLLWGGWTLVFSAEPSAVAASPGGEPADGWARAYFAGFAAFTLGVGDYAPVGAPWQLLTILATISGLGLTTMAITYLVSVVGAVTQRRKQAALIAGLGSHAPEIVTRAWHGGSIGYLDQILPRLADELQLTAQRHLTYPVLHYFHPRDAPHDLRLQAAALDEALTLAEHGIKDPTAKPHPVSMRLARSAVGQLLEHAPGATADRTPPPPPELGPLREAGIPTVDDAEFGARVAKLADHRGALAAYSASSRPQRDT